MNTFSESKIKRTRVKICGITRVEDALHATRSGADAIGFVFYEKSPRYIIAEKAAEIARSLPPFISIVALFVNATDETINSVLDMVPVDVLQFHGEENQQMCQCYDRPYIKAIRMRDNIDILKLNNEYTGASALLLDSFVQGIQGGTGQKFDWSKVPTDLDKPIILAGGLTAKNVAAAILQVCPYAVDVSGGVEIQHGIKDAAKIETFIQEVLHAK